MCRTENETLHYITFFFVKCDGTTSLRSIIKYLFHVTFMRLVNFSNIKTIKFTFINMKLCNLLGLRLNCARLLVNFDALLWKMITNCLLFEVSIFSTFSHFSIFLNVT